MCSQEELRKGALYIVQVHHQAEREKRSVEKLPGSVLGDYVLVAHPRKVGSTPEVVLTPTGPWKMLARSAPLYVIQDIVAGETNDDHVARMRAYAYSSLVVRSKLRDVLEMTKYQDEYEMAGMLANTRRIRKSGWYRSRVSNSRMK